MAFASKHLTSLFKCCASIMTRAFHRGPAITHNLPQSVYASQRPSNNFAYTSRLTQPIYPGLITRLMASLFQMHKRGPPEKKRRKKNPLGENKPFAKGIVIRSVIKKPKKPNSANRKCVLVKLSTGKEMTAYIPGEGHNLQEHNVVLCRVGRLRDVPGVKIRCVRGKYDLGHVIKRTQ